MINAEENIRTLSDLGLTSGQAKIYLALLRTGTASIRKIALASGVARPDAYRVLSELQEMGIVEKIVALPTEVKPLPIEDAIGILMLRKTKESLDLNKRAGKLLEHLKEKTIGPHIEDNQFFLIQGDAIELELQKLLEKAKDNISIMISRKEMLQWLINRYAKILKALKRGVTIKIITEESCGTNLSKKIISLQKFPNFECRCIVGFPAVGFRMCDNQEILLTTSNLKANYVAVFSNNSSLIKLAQNYFSSAWFSAVEPQDQKFKHDSRQFDYLFSNLTSGFTYNKMIFGAQGEPVDFVVLETNKAFVEKSKIAKNILGERASKILSNDSWKNFIALLGKHWPTISSGKSVIFEYFSVDLRKWFSVLSYSPENGYFACIFEDITERKKAEEVQLKSEANLKNLINGMNDTVWVIDFDRNFIDLNDAAVKALGYSRDELLSLGIKGIDNYLSHEQSKKILAQLVRDGHIVFETVHTTKDGLEIPVEINSSLITHSGKQAILSIARNITERKKAQDALIESEAHYRNLINGMNETAWVIDFNGNFVDVNTAAGKTLGYSKEELLTMGLKDIDKAFNQEEFENHLRTMPAVGTKVFERVQTAKDGTEIPVEISSSLITYHGEQATLSIARNITERKKLEEESQRLFATVQQERDRLSSLLNSMTDEVWFANAEKKFTLANPSAIKEFKLDSSAAQCVDVENLAATSEVYRSDGSLRPVEEAPPLRALRGEIVKNQEEIVRTPRSGELRTRLVSSTPIKNNRGTIIGSVSVVRDITERKKSEELLKESEEKFRNLAEESPNMIFIYKRDKVVYVNKKCEENMGYSKEEIYSPNFNILDLAAPEYKETLASNFKAHFQGKEVSPLECAGIIKEGKRIEVILSTKLIKYEGENAVLGTATDITDRLKKEFELRQERDKLEAVTRTTGVGLSVVGPDFQVLWANRVLKDLFGDVESKKCYSAFHERDQLCPDCGVNKIFQNGESSDRREVRAEYGRGKGDWLEITAVPFKNDKGQVMAALETGVEITERKKAEEALRQSEAYYRQLFGSITEMFQVLELIYDKDGKAIDYYYREVNPAFERLVGKSSVQLVGKRVKDVFGIVEGYWLEAFDKVAKTGVPAIIENYGAELDKYYEVHVWKVIDKENQVASVFTDISERKKAEEKNAWLASFPMHNPNPVLEVSFEGKISYVNSATEHIFPDLKKADLNHPFFSGWEQVVAAFKEDKRQTFERDIKIGNAWFRQQYQLVSETGWLRIYVTNITKNKAAEKTKKC